MLSLVAFKKELRSHADPVRAKSFERFSKTGKGEYGEGDRFLGIFVPDIRSLVKKYRDVPILMVLKLLRSEYNEERLCALLLFVSKFERSKSAVERERVFDLYLRNTKYINGWGLVDVTAHKIVGAYLLDKPRDILYRLANSKRLWDRRIAIIASWAFIARGQFDDTLKLSEILLHDPHDLIHKAAGWMLREVGKKDVRVLENFLDQHAAEMPRTMLRYAIEKLLEGDRKKYLNVGRASKEKRRK